MVQVDVFWAYGFGASLAVASGRQLKDLIEPYTSSYFQNTILFLALVWAPTGLLLLLRHPSWETMQAAQSITTMSEWVILTFGVTNITQGILGFWIGQRLMAKRKYYLANLNWIAGYIGMFFILLYGWDGLGYDRFLYDRDMVAGAPAWVPGIGTAQGVSIALYNFLFSGVFTTLLTDAIVLLPVFFYLMNKWMVEGYNGDSRIKMDQIPSRLKLTLSYLAGVFIVGGGVAVISATSVGSVAQLLNVGEVVLHNEGWYAPINVNLHILSYIIGLPLAAVVSWFLLLKPGMPFHAILKPWCIDELNDSDNKFAKVALR